MHSLGCSKLPTVEECTRVAQRITNQCLRACVTAQCSGVTVRCGDRRALALCGRPRAQGEVGGFVDSKKTETCQVPLDELRWCELPMAASCRPLVMVHELAHTCGWDH